MDRRRAARRAWSPESLTRTPGADWRGSARPDWRRAGYSGSPRVLLALGVRWLRFHLRRYHRLVRHGHSAREDAVEHKEQRGRFASQRITAAFADNRLTFQHHIPAAILLSTPPF